MVLIPHLDSPLHGHSAFAGAEVTILAYPLQQSPSLSPDSSDIDTTSSGPPSLETGMGPELGYKTSGLASNTD